jgi:hypothetical protein
MRAFAEALDAIPMALAENSGLSPIETLAAIKSRQVKENNSRLGVDCMQTGSNGEFCADDCFLFSPVVFLVRDADRSSFLFPQYCCRYCTLAAFSLQSSSIMRTIYAYDVHIALRGAAFATSRLHLWMLPKDGLGRWSRPTRHCINHCMATIVDPHAQRHVPATRSVCVHVMGE